MTVPELPTRVPDAASEPPADARAWAAVASIGVGAFVMVTSEFLPIGLLGRIATDLETTTGAAGLLLTAPGVTAAIAAPVAVLCAGRMDRRLILLALTILIVVSNLAMAAASDLGFALAARAVLGASVGGFWAFSTAAGRRLVPEASGARATTLVLIGISLGTVLGVPAGAVLGDWLGWRAAFLIAAGAAGLVAVAQTGLLPSLVATAAPPARALAALLRNRLAVTGLVASACLAAGHFAAYTYLEPYLRQAVRLSPASVGLVLAAYGVAGLAGTFLGEYLAARRLRASFIGVAVVLAVAIVAATGLGGLVWAATPSVILWGLAFGAVPVMVQIWTYRAEPAAFEAGSALTVTAFELALAVGAASGGKLFDTFGLQAAFGAGAVACLTGAAVLLLARARFSVKAAVAE